MTKEMEKAFDFAADLAKQLITLATGVIAVIITFFDKSGSESSTSIPVTALGWPLSLYMVSVVFGIISLMALTGQLVSKGTAATPNAINARVIAGFQIVLFLVATIWTLVVVLHGHHPAPTGGVTRGM